MPGLRLDSKVWITAAFDTPPSHWRTRAALELHAPPPRRVWMDAFLAAFAISGNLLLLTITLDHDVKTRLPHGLRLTLLHPGP